MKTYVLYHGNCYDGFGSAVVASQILLGAEYIPVQYGRPMPAIDRESRVYILDFSYPAETLMQLIHEGQCEVTLLDHHKTAEADLAGLQHDAVPGLYIAFDMNESGASLAWRYFFPNNTMPAMIRYIRDRDLWRWELPESREISCALASYPFDFDEWSDLLRLSEPEYREKMSMDGAACLRQQDRMVERMCTSASIRTIGGHTVPVANATGFFSEVGEQLCLDHPQAPFAAYFAVRADGKYQYGLRSRSGFDVSEVAKLYGGGGHAAAAGFVSDVIL